MAQRPPAGYRTLPHTADIRIEAWAPTRERCVCEAVLGMVGSFAEASGIPEVATERLRIEPGPDEDMLVAVLDEVVFLMDTTGRLPIGAEATDVEDGGLEVRLRMADADRMEPVGAVPKAVSLHELRFGRDERGWSCTVTLDI